jgi:putative ATP-dependent endonuclease of OLD family
MGNGAARSSSSPAGGVGSPEQAQQLAWLGCSRFHLIDREVPPETVYRENTATALNALPNCVAFVTGKRSLENYLHPQAILEARGVAVSFGDDEDVGSLVARELHQRRNSPIAWEDLDRRTKKRLRNRAKRWLNAEAAGRMTPELLAERDPHGEVRGWLAVIAKLTGGE